MRQMDFFPPPPRKRPRKLMWVVDAGYDGQHIVHFECRHCGYDDGWTASEGLTKDKRGRPCPRCNPAEPQE